LTNGYAKRYKKEKTIIMKIPIELDILEWSYAILILNRFNEMSKENFGSEPIMYSDIARMINEIKKQISLFRDEKLQGMTKEEFMEIMKDDLKI
jgi:hypothetical protein